MDYNIVYSLIITSKILLVITLPLIVFALMVAYLIMYDNKYINSILEILINIPVIFPPIGLGFLLVYCFSRDGYFADLINVNLIFSFSGICVGAYITGIPFITRAVLAGLNREIIHLCEASYTLGCSRFSTYLCIVVPQLKNNIMQGLVLAVGRIVGEVGITLMIGGNIYRRTTTISLDIYNAVMDGENTKAALLAGILFGFSLLVFFLLKRISNNIKI